MAERKITDIADLFVVIYPAATVDMNLLVVAVAVPELAAVRLDAYLLKICAHVTHQLVAHDKWRCHWGWRLGGWWRWAVANLDPVNTVSVDRRETHHSRNPKHSAQQKLHHHLARRASFRRRGPPAAARVAGGRRAGGGAARVRPRRPAVPAPRSAQDSDQE